MEQTFKKFQITFVLDRSGSMETVRDATISGFNEFLNTQKNAAGEAKVTLIQFDDVIETPYSGLNIKNVASLNRDTFVPRNMTALYDAIKEAIKKTEASLTWSKGKVKPLIVILTDGLENRSRTRRDEIISLITQKQDEGWDFVYIGANQDAWSVGKGMGIRGNFTYSYDANPESTVKTFKGLSNSTTLYRSSVSSGQYAGSQNYNFFDDGHKNVNVSSNTINADVTNSQSEKTEEK